MRKKSELYEIQQNEIISKLENILQLPENNNITLHELDNNNKIKDEIINLIPDIRKYYNYNNITAITDTINCKRPQLAIIRFIIRKKYEMYNCDIRLADENKKKTIRTTKYIFIKK